jgi:hypothetical protein
MLVPRKKAGFIYIAALSLSVSASAEPAGTTTKIFRWVYDQEWYSLTHTFQNSTYAFYKSRPRTYSNYADYVRESSTYPFIAEFATKLKQLGAQKGLNEWETANLIVKFVQSIPYRTDIGEYPRFPIETLVDFKADCEDSAILLAAILSYLGYDVLLVSPPGHMAVAVACSNCQGSYYARDGKRYFYVETTSNGWSIGNIPSQYKNREAKLYSVTPSATSNSVAATKSAIPAGLDPGDSDRVYTALLTVDGITYRVRIVQHPDGSWTYE